MQPVDPHESKFSPDAPAFELQAVDFDYQGIAALRSLSLVIQRGQRVALVGANGSGKSTLLRLLDALCFPTGGSIRFFAQSMSERAFADDNFNLAFRRRVGLVFQNPDVQLFNPTVFDEVAFGPLQLGWPREQLLQRIDETLALLGITRLKERPPYRLSGGEKKRVALASVLVMDPEVLLLDEPTAALDPKSQSQVADLVQGWRSTAKTVVTATHQLELLEEIADVVHVLEAGAIVASGTPNEILADRALLERANLVHAHRHRHGSVVHSHPHSHGHAGHTHDHGHGDPAGNDAK